MKAAVGIIGVGMMGHGIARNVLKHGFALTALEHPGNQPLTELLAGGATTQTTARAVAQASDVVVLCVTGSPEVEAVLTGPEGVLEGLRPGAIVVDCSTAIPTATERMAALVQARGARFVDAPMTRSVQHAHEGKLNLLVGGDAADTEAVMPVLRCFAENIVLTGVTWYARAPGGIIREQIRAPRATYAAPGWRLEQPVRFDVAGATTEQLPSMVVGKELSPARIDLQSVDPDSQSFWELSETIDAFAAAGRNTEEMRAKWWHRLSGPLSALLMPLLGSVAAFGLARSGQLFVRAIIGMALGFAYFVVDNAALAMGSVGSLAADDLRHKQGATASQEKTRMWMIIGGTHRFAVTPEDNPTARAFAQMLPLTLDMSDLNDNEKHVRLPRSLPTNAVRPGTIRTGDVMLYGSDTLVVFYKTFPSSYSYTRIGSVTQVDGLVQALGTGSQRIGFALRQKVGNERRQVRGGNAHNARQTIDCELHQRRTRLGGQHHRQVLIASQLGGCRNDATHEQIFKRLCAIGAI